MHINILRNIIYCDNIKGMSCKYWLKNVITDKRFHARFHMHKSNPLYTNQLKRVKVYRQICQERDQLYADKRFFISVYQILCLILNTILIVISLMM